MKQIILLLTGVVLIFSVTTGNTGKGLLSSGSNSQNLITGDSIMIVTSPELFDLASAWGREYVMVNPSAGFSIKRGNIDNVDNNNAIYIVNDNHLAGFKESAGWSMVIGHNAVIPVFNANNPMVDRILARGLRAEEFGKILTTGTRWSEIIPGGPKEKIGAVITDGTIKEVLVTFTGIVAENIKCEISPGVEGFVSAIRKDPFAIGFCRLSEIIKQGQNELADNIILLPVDKNRNGRIDTFEKIFDSPADLSRGIWIGKYPHSLSVTIYAAARVKPSAAGELAFLSWVLTGGGAVLTAHGYSDLAGIEKQSGLAALDINKISVRPVDSRTASFTWLIILLCSGVAGVIVIFAFGMTGKEKRASSVIRSTRTPGPLNAATITTAGGVYYDKTHTWAHMEKDGLVRIGIDDFLQHVTGDISKVLLKEPGTAVRRGEPVLTIIREGKQLRIYAPVSGIIRAQNTNLFIDSSIINASPYSDGWIYLIEPGNWLREIQLMFMTASYKKWLEEEFSRLKIFFTGTLKQEPAFAKLPVLQDGGELTDNILADLGPEVWEEFQISFIDSSR